MSGDVIMNNLAKKYEKTNHQHDYKSFEKEYKVGECNDLGWIVLKRLNDVHFEKPQAEFLKSRQNPILGHSLLKYLNVIGFREIPGH